MKFEDLKITRQFLNALEDAGFDTPTPIQEQAIPRVRSGQDVIGIAQTGTGKTAAYLLPLLQTINYAQGTAPRCLILVPTKELVLQVLSQAGALTTYTDIRIVGLYGGIGPRKQASQVEEGCDIIVATPGRFLEIYRLGAIVTKKIKHLVLDEADRMMDMGFMHQIRSVQEVIPQKRQNLLFSATFPERVEKLSEEFLLWPQKIEVTPQATPVESIDQYAYEVPNFRTKLELLMHLLESNPEDMNRVMVFTRSRTMAENIGKYLDRKLEGDVRTIHSNKGQNSRINAMNDFRKGEVRILVSTDVSSRGIDITDISHVVNFSVPRLYEDYVHRIGRTGRVFKAGVAITFFDRAERYHIKKIEDLIKQRIPLLDFPTEVEILRTPKDEFQDQAREIDDQKKRENPDYKGAFHDKKRKPARKPKGKSAGRKKGRKR
ncbi:MAG: DEAD/DEAH box helicase [Flavobacteriales bacterium]|nr:DEAD/DEAH box helicase [Flavobacteriales bacterium]